MDLPVIKRESLHFYMIKGLKPDKIQAWTEADIIAMRLQFYHGTDKF